MEPENEGRTESVERSTSNHEPITLPLVQRIPSLRGELVRPNEECKARNADEDTLIDASIFEPGLTL